MTTYLPTNAASTGAVLIAKVGECTRDMYPACAKKLGRD
jgi:hypothetical protein